MQAESQLVTIPKARNQLALCLRYGLNWAWVEYTQSVSLYLLYRPIFCILYLSFHLPNGRLPLS